MRRRRGEEEDGAGPGQEPRRWFTVWIQFEGRAKRLYGPNERVGSRGRVEDAEWDSQGLLQSQLRSTQTFFLP